MILCSEKCFHEEDGLCTLKEVTHPSSTPIKDCLYFKDKQRLNSKVEETPSSLEVAPDKFL